jgi:hypothetical protein
VRGFGTRRVILGLACALLLTSCSSSEGQGSDPMQVVENPVAATPAASPVTTTEPAGRVLSVPVDVTALATDDRSRTLVAALTEPAELRLYDLDNLGTTPRSVPLPGPAEQLSVAGGAVVASVPSAGQLVRVALPGGEVSTVDVPGQPAATTQSAGKTLVAVRDRKSIAVLAQGEVTKTISGELYSADRVVTSGGQAVVLDRLRTALFQVDVAAGTVDEGLRAGFGAANVVADSFGRVLVTDTRAGALLAFSTDPLLLRQRYPVPGGIYGIAYDTKRHLAWVTLTERNQVVGFDVRGGEPTEKYRIPSVRQPNSVTVDERSGRVVVGSAAGEGIQVIEP